MINIDEYRKFLYFLINKSGKVTPSPDDLNTASARAYFEWFNKRYNSPAEYRYDMPTPRVGYDASSRVMDDLKDFKVILPFNVDSEGKVML